MKRWILGLVLASGCSNAPTGDQCQRLLDHLVDLEFRRAGAAAPDGKSEKSDLAKQKQILADQKQAVLDARSAEFLDNCAKHMARQRVECGLATGDLDAFARCDEAK